MQHVHHIGHAGCLLCKLKGANNKGCKHICCMYAITSTVTCDKSIWVKLTDRLLGNDFA
jgi:hypothetical protein